MSWQWDFFVSTILQAAHAKDEMPKGKDNAGISKDNGHLKREETLKGEMMTLEGKFPCRWVKFIGWAHSPWFQWLCGSKGRVCTGPYLSLGKALSGKRRQKKSVLYSLGFNNSSLLPNVCLTVLHTGLSSKQGWGTLHLEQTPCNLVLRSFPWEMWAWTSLGRCLPLPFTGATRGHCPSICRGCFLNRSPQVPELKGNVLGWGSSSVGGEQRWPRRSALCTWDQEV